MADDSADRERDRYQRNQQQRGANRLTVDVKAVPSHFSK
jgi:hypothetical protein